MAVPRDEFVGGQFGEQQRWEKVGGHDQHPRREAPQAGWGGVEDEPVDREGSTVELPADIPET